MRLHPFTGYQPYCLRSVRPTVVEMSAGSAGGSSNQTADFGEAAAPAVDGVSPEGSSQASGDSLVGVMVNPQLKRPREAVAGAGGEPRSQSPRSGVYRGSPGSHGGTSSVAPSPPPATPMAWPAPPGSAAASASAAASPGTRSGVEGFDMARFRNSIAEAGRRSLGLAPPLGGVSGRTSAPVGTGGRLPRIAEPARGSRSPASTSERGDDRDGHTTPPRRRDPGAVPSSPVGSAPPSRGRPPGAASSAPGYRSASVGGAPAAKASADHHVVTNGLVTPLPVVRPPPPVPLRGTATPLLSQPPRPPSGTESLILVSRREIDAALAHVDHMRARALEEGRIQGGEWGQQQLSMLEEVTDESMSAAHDSMRLLAECEAHLGSAYRETEQWQDKCDHLETEVQVSNSKSDMSKRAYQDEIEAVRIAQSELLRARMCESSREQRAAFEISELRDRNQVETAECQARLSTHTRLEEAAVMAERAQTRQLQQQMRDAELRVAAERQRVSTAEQQAEAKYSTLGTSFQELQTRHRILEATAASTPTSGLPSGFQSEIEEQFKTIIDSEARSLKLELEEYQTRSLSSRAEEAEMARKFQTVRSELSEAQDRIQWQNSDFRLLQGRLETEEQYARRMPLMSSSSNPELVAELSRARSAEQRIYQEVADVNHQLARSELELGQVKNDRDSDQQKIAEKEFEIEELNQRIVDWEDWHANQPAPQADASTVQQPAAAEAEPYQPAGAAANGLASVATTVASPGGVAVPPAVPPPAGAGHDPMGGFGMSHVNPPHMPTGIPDFVDYTDVMDWIGRQPANAPSASPSSFPAAGQGAMPPPYGVGQAPNVPGGMAPPPNQPAGGIPSPSQPANFPWAPSPTGMSPGGHVPPGAAGGLGSPTNEASYQYPIRKEAEKIVVPAFPNLLNIQAWKAQLTAAVCTASGRTDVDVVIAWLSRCWVPGITPRELDVTEPQFVSLDQKLLQGMVGMLSQGGAGKDKAKVIKHRLDIEAEQAISRHRLATGRHAVFFLIDELRSFEDGDTLFGMDHLSSMQVVNNDLQDFMQRWDRQLGRLPDVLATSSQHIVGMLYRKVRTHPDLLQLVSRYESFPLGSRGKTYEWLYSEIQKILLQQRKNRNMDERDQLLRESNMPQGKKAAAGTPAIADDPNRPPPRNPRTPKANGGDPNITPALAAGVGPGNANTPKGGGKGKKGGKGDGGPSSPPGAQKGHCLQFLRGETCPRLKCGFQHDHTLTKAQKKELIKEIEAKIAAKTAAKGKGAGGSPPKPPGGSPAKQQACFTFIRTGACPKRPECEYQHVTREEAVAKGWKVPPEAKAKANSAIIEVPPPPLPPGGVAPLCWRPCRKCLKVGNITSVCQHSHAPTPSVAAPATETVEAQPSSSGPVPRKRVRWDLYGMSFSKLVIDGKRLKGSRMLQPTGKRLPEGAVGIRQDYFGHWKDRDIPVPVLEDLAVERAKMWEAVCRNDGAEDIATGQIRCGEVVCNFQMFRDDDTFSADPDEDTSVPLFTTSYALAECEAMPAPPADSPSQEVTKDDESGRSEPPSDRLACVTDVQAGDETCNPPAAITVHEEGTVPPPVAVVAPTPMCDNISEVSSNDSNPDNLPSYPPGAILCDTGCGSDLISRAGAKGYPKKTVSPITFQTAGGKTTARESVAFYCPELRSAVEPLVLDNTPWVLSIGRRCIEEGYSFVWINKSPPIFVAPDGTTTQLSVINYIPYLYVGHAVPAAGVVESVSRESTVPVAVPETVSAAIVLDESSSDSDPDVSLAPVPSHDARPMRSSLRHRVAPNSPTVEEPSSPAAAVDGSPPVGSPTAVNALMSESVVAEAGSGGEDGESGITSDPDRWASPAPDSDSTSQGGVEGVDFIVVRQCAECCGFPVNAGYLCAAHSVRRLGPSILRRTSPSTSPFQRRRGPNHPDHVPDVAVPAEGEAEGEPVEEEAGPPPLPPPPDPLGDEPAGEDGDERGAEGEEQEDPPPGGARRDLRELANSPLHLLTHLPKNKYCQTCQLSKMKQAYSKRGAFQRETDRFGAIVTCDHLFSSGARMQGLSGEHNAFTIMDIWSGMLGVYPTAGKFATEVAEALREFVGGRKVDNVYSDNADELIAGMNALGIKHDTSVPGVHHTNSLIERTNQIIRGGTVCALIKAGLPPCYWSVAAPCFAHNYNAAGPRDPTPWSQVTGDGFVGKLFPFGCKVIFVPTPDSTREVGEKWDTKGRFGIFAGYKMRNSFTWSGSYYVWDLKEFSNADLRTASTRHNQRLSSPQVVKRCELPVEEGICFPLKAEFDRINADLFDPLLAPQDPFDLMPDGAPEARAPRIEHLIGEPGEGDAEVPVGGNVTPPLPDPADPPPVLEGGVDSPIEHADGGGAGEGELDGPGGGEEVKPKPGIVKVRPAEGHHYPTLFSRRKDRPPYDNIILVDDEGFLVKRDINGRPYPVDALGVRLVAGSKRPAFMDAAEYAQMLRQERAKAKKRAKSSGSGGPGPVPDDAPAEASGSGDPGHVPDDAPAGAVTAALEGLDVFAEVAFCAAMVPEAQARCVEDVRPCMAMPDVEVKPVISRAAFDDLNDYILARAWQESKHRPRHQRWRPPMPFPAMVTRIVSKAEARLIPEAMEALKKEFAGLSSKCWVEADRRPRAEVIAEAKAKGIDIQFSAVYGIIGEKGSELPKGDPRRKFKGRGVLLGNRVFDQDFCQATFSDMGNAPTLMEGARFTDAYGCLPGHGEQQADAVQAYIQAPMRGPICYVSLPPEAVQNPDFYYAVKDPVVPLLLALYGHPDSPTYWEQYADECVQALGFAPVGPEWPSLYFHEGLRLMLSIYVDDFKLSGPVENLQKGWDLIRSKITIEDPTPVGLYLGCQQDIHYVVGEETTTAIMVYNMEAFLEQCLEKYTGCEGHMRLKPASTPFLQDSSVLGPERAASAAGIDPDQREISAEELEVALAGGQPKTQEESDDARPGDMATHAPSVLMKVMYAARMARFDLLKAVQGLACYLTKWTHRQDRELHRLMCYISATKQWRLCGWMADPIDRVNPIVFSDADYAGTSGSTRSTSGAFVGLMGPRSSFPISSQSKRQTATSTSTTEAELTAAQQALQRQGVPALDLWDTLCKGNQMPGASLGVLLDNTAMIEIIRRGRNLTIRSMSKTHGVCVWPGCMSCMSVTM